MSDDSYSVLHLNKTSQTLHYYWSLDFQFCSTRHPKLLIVLLNDLYFLHTHHSIQLQKLSLEYKPSSRNQCPDYFRHSNNLT